MNNRGLFPLLAFILTMISTSVRAEIRVGEIFPPLASPGLVGANVPATLGKVVLVDFWASWCAPCKASFPAYMRLHSAFASKGLVIVAVSVDQDAAAFASFVRKFNPPFLVVLDRNQRLVREVQVPTMPTSYLIDREGRVMHIHPGFRGVETEEALRREIEKMLSN